MKSASGKRPPDEAHGAPEKKLSSRSSYALGSREKRVHTSTRAHVHVHVHAAEIGTTLIQKKTPVTRGTAPGWCKKHAALKYE